MNTNTRTYGPFTWTKRIRTAEDIRQGRTEEVWELERPDGFTSFCLKNYGGKPVLDPRASPFTGWRLVSGGPFSQVGGWESFEEALPVVTPWLGNYYRKQAEELVAKASRMIQFATNFVDTITP